MQIDNEIGLGFSLANEVKMTDRQKDISKIVDALEAGGRLYQSRSMDSVRVERKSGGDPVTDAEREVNHLLFEALVREGEGWFSEETADSPDRLHRSRIWIVDPLDGTKEYVTRIPEWCISIALLEGGKLVAAGVLNPLTDELFYGTPESGITYQDRSGRGFNADSESSDMPLVLASRSECNRGEWERFRGTPIRLRPMGSVAYKLALVAAGRADVTWTLVPKHEWDVAAGVALLLAAHGTVLRKDGVPPSFNQINPLLPGLVGLSASGIFRMQPLLKTLSITPGFEDCLSWLRPLLESQTRQ
ncbi:MAG TPA: 3'(2'),5'-bisphosphate nucleotidase CysQ [Candidatus Acidoferrales bacterium]|nr:3'(2'),5'-bisphosphate nucleotidase CysQ [Candidatus Acidoferrales bacterium]